MSGRTRWTPLSAIAHSTIHMTRRLRITRALTVAALVATAFASTASAQGPNREAEAAAPATTRALYQAYLAADCFPGSNFCRFDSENVPARGVLEIQKVSCQGWHDNTQDPNFVVIGELRTGVDAYVGRIHFFRTTYETGGTGLVWTIADQTLIFIPATHKLRISLNSGTTGVGSSQLHDLRLPDDIVGRH